MTDKHIGVFVCRCGGNISDYVDVEQVVERIKDHDGVQVAKVNMFSCSDAAQEEMIELIKEKALDGIVIASCSPKLHLNTFRSMAGRAGLNPYQYVQVNIREQCSWTHTHDKAGATDKAARLVRAGIEAALRSEPLSPIEVSTKPAVLIVGAGITGLRAAIGLGEMGIECHLIEESDTPGGLVSKRRHLFPNDNSGERIVHRLLTRIEGLEKVNLYTKARLVDKKGSIGDFYVTIEHEISATGSQHLKTLELQVGAIIVATGAVPYEPRDGEYGYRAPNCLTLKEYLSIIEQSKKGEVLEINGRKIEKVAYIYCVGSREPAGQDGAKTYCSRYCCTSAIYSGILTHEKHPAIQQYHIYRDIRTYGSYESLYQKALEQGAIFIKYSPASPPEIVREQDHGPVKAIMVKDLLTRKKELFIEPDLLVLVTGLVPRDNQQINSLLKVPIGKDGFYNEVHPKLRPVETVVDGLFIAGCCQGPKNAAESVQGALGAAAKAGALLLKGKVSLEPFVATIDLARCDMCEECIDACPYGALELVHSEAEGRFIRVNQGLCKGEGSCVPVCPKEAIEIKGYEHNKIKAMIDGLLKED